MIFQPKTWIWLTALFCFGFFVYWIHGVLLPFVAGFAIAYALTPAVERSNKFYLSRTIVSTVLIILIFLLIAALLVFAIPFLTSELLKLAHNLPTYGENLFNSLIPLLEKLSKYVDIGDIHTWKAQATKYFSDMFSWSLKVLADILTNSLALANLISLIILTPLIAFYILRDWPKLMKYLKTLIPRPQESLVLDLAKKVHHTLGRYVRGQVLVSLILGTYYSIGLILIGLDYAIILGIVTGLLAFIPYVGLIIGGGVAIGVALAQFGEWHSIYLVLIVLITGSILEGKFLTPQLIGNSIGLHPVWIIFALLAFGSVFGFSGLLLAMPLAAILSVLIRFFVAQYRKSSLYLGKSTSS